MEKGREGYVSRLSPVTGIRWTWFGGHGIHGYIGSKRQKREIAFLNAGDFSKDSMTEEEAVRAIERLAHLTSEEQSQYAVNEHEMRLIATGKYHLNWNYEKEKKKLAKV